MSRLDKIIQGVPYEIMKSRLMLIASTAFLIAFGLVMVYSASFVQGVTQDGQEPASYFIKQLASLGVGLVGCYVVMKIDYHKWLVPGFLTVLVAASDALLLLVLFAGRVSNGAGRWLSIGPFSLQPTELVKSVVILACAACTVRYLATKKTNREGFLLELCCFCGISLVLIFLQPDKGTVFTLGITLWLMLWVAGIQKRVLILSGVAFAAVFFLYSVATPYSQARLAAMINPLEDAGGNSYQLLQGFYAFASGGLFGCGLGNSHQKYAYLPEAHNDFIFAVIGEELGLIGCLVMLGAFVILLIAGLRIARTAPDLLGRLIAYGSTMLLIVAVLVNVAGVIGLFPMTGKAIPFISDGGSSMIGSLLLVGLILSVSKRSSLPRTTQQARREKLSVAPRTAPASSRLKLTMGGKRKSGPSTRKRGT